MKNVFFLLLTPKTPPPPQKDDPIIKSKDELIQLVHREDPIVQPFRKWRVKNAKNSYNFSSHPNTTTTTTGLFESKEAHCLTDYWKWYYTAGPYTLSTRFHDKYEPYIIVE